MSSSIVPPGFARPSIPALDNTYGAMMLGTFIGIILYGVNFSPRPTAIYVKAMVTIVFTLETLHSVLVMSMHSVYYYLVKNYFNPVVLFHGSWSINVLALLTGILFPVFFARRLWLINYRFRPLVAFIAILLVAQAGFTIAITVEAFIQPDLTRYEDYSWMISAELGIVLIADVLMTTLLIITFRRSRTGFRSTEQLLNTLITYAICTVYANSLLAVLNSRYFLHTQGKESVSTGPSWSNALPTEFRSHGDKFVSHQNTGSLQETLEIRIASNVMRDIDSAGGEHLDSYELDQFSARDGGLRVPPSVKHSLYNTPGMSLSLSSGCACLNYTSFWPQYDIDDAILYLYSGAGETIPAFLVFATKRPVSKVVFPQLNSGSL
ncbi:hypothetical protein GY45DRAFT_1373488 [Cubamyces sp. BRFM 1775]|nr:hypothetical protein GY45DRAFT_1373488 [Cubamyces sp. BRFM 1775]